jgi:hypothetical protein
VQLRLGSASHGVQIILELTCAKTGVVTVAAARRSGMLRMLNKYARFMAGLDLGRSVGKGDRYDSRALYGMTESCASNNKTAHVKPVRHSSCTCPSSVCVQ